MGFCGTCTNIFFIFCNVLIFLIGAALLALGVTSYVAEDWFYGDMKDASQNVATQYYGDLREHIGIVLLVIGSVLILISILGCVASGMRSRCLLGVYLSILFSAFAVSLAFAIYILIKWQEGKDGKLTSSMEEASDKVKITFGVLFGFSGVMLITFIVGACLCSCIGRSRDGVI